MTGGCGVTSLKTHAEAELNLAFAIVVGGVDGERLAEGGGVGFESGEEGERGESAGESAGGDGVAGGFNLGDVLMVEEVEGLGEKLQLAQMAEVELLAEAHVGFPCGGIAEGVAADVVDDLVVADAVNAIVAGGAVHAGAECGDRLRR